MRQSGKRNSPKPLPRATGKRVIVCHGNLLGELLATHLKKATGEKWAVIRELSGLGPVVDDPTDDKCRRLVLWDGGNRKTDLLCKALERCASIQVGRDQVALFNLRRGTGIEQVCMWRGISGFFYEDDDLEHVAQGVMALLAGRVWFTPDQVDVPPPPVVDEDGLPPPWNLIISRREQEVLELLARGNTNQEISESLSISPHTVKTHAYNLFKKIQVSNRLEAVIWYTSLISSQD